MQYNLIKSVGVKYGVAKFDHLWFVAKDDVLSIQLGNELTNEDLCTRSKGRDK